MLNDLIDKYGDLQIKIRALQEMSKVVKNCLLELVPVTRALETISVGQSVTVTAKRFSAIFIKNEDSVVMHVKEVE